QCATGGRGGPRAVRRREHREHSRRRETRHRSRLHRCRAAHDRVPGKPLVRVRLFLRRIGRMLARPAVYLTILLVLLAIIIWFLGPFMGTSEIKPLAPASVRLGLLLLLALVWGIGGALMRVRRSSEEQSLLAGLRK